MCFHCARTGMKVCDGRCPFDHESACRDCPRTDELKKEQRRY